MRASDAGVGKSTNHTAFAAADIWIDQSAWHFRRHVIAIVIERQQSLAVPDYFSRPVHGFENRQSCGADSRWNAAEADGRFNIGRGCGTPAGE
jgi:hypothetical protein